MIEIRQLTPRNISRHARVELNGITPLEISMCEGRLLVFGDIHGHLLPLNVLLDFLNPTFSDIVVTLGDYVDRGPDSFGVLARLVELKKQTKLIPILGNHDLMFSEILKGERFPEGWLFFGGGATLSSFGISVTDPDFSRVPQWVHEFFFQECLPFWESAEFLFVHAGLASGLSLQDQSVDTLFWEKLQNPKPHVSGKTVVYGHSRQLSGWPLWLGHHLCLDTNVYGGGWLTCCELNSLEFWQVNAAGEFRHGSLDKQLKQGPG